jgi:hypothetical protein
LGLGPRQRGGYEAYLEGRVLELGIKARRKELEASWRSLRRGWYVGGEEFKAELLDQAAAALAGKRPESHTGAGHDQSRAERMLVAGLKRLKVRRSDLASLPKGQPEKQVLAWWLYGNTTVRRRWLAEQLEMGYETRISQAAGAVEASRDPVVLEMKNKLMEHGT